jgi:hypothetical protein
MKMNDVLPKVTVITEEPRHNQSVTFFSVNLPTIKHGRAEKPIQSVSAVEKWLVRALRSVTALLNRCSSHSNTLKLKKQNQTAEIKSKSVQTQLDSVYYTELHV